MDSSKRKGGVRFSNKNWEGGYNFYLKTFFGGSSFKTLHFFENHRRRNVSNEEYERIFRLGSSGLVRSTDACGWLRLPTFAVLHFQVPHLAESNSSFLFSYRRLKPKCL